jgi:hypothetical protein
MFLLGDIFPVGFFSMEFFSGGDFFLGGLFFTGGGSSGVFFQGVTSVQETFLPSTTRNLNRLL